MLHMKNIDNKYLKYEEILKKKINLRTARWTTSSANNLAAKLLFNIFKNHYFCAHLDIFHATREKYQL